MRKRRGRKCAGERLHLIFFCRWTPYTTQKLRTVRRAAYIWFERLHSLQCCQAGAHYAWNNSYKLWMWIWNVNRLEEKKIELASRAAVTNLGQICWLNVTDNNISDCKWTGWIPWKVNVNGVVLPKQALLPINTGWTNSVSLGAGLSV